MNKQAFAILEFDSLRALVRRNAQTEMGRARIASLEPINNIDELRQALSAVAESVELRRHGAHLSFDSLADPSESISRLKIEGTALDPLAILDLARLCERALNARAAILAEHENYPTLFEIVAALPAELKKLTSLLTKKILPSGELDDRASPQLASIRRDIANARSRITRTLENLMRRSSEAVQEELVTIRNDRFVIPVRADHRGRINGVAHGSSSSGATIFVEPLETIEANNQLQTLREAEQREIAEILFSLSENLRHELPAIELAANAVAELDFIGAKAAFAERFSCVIPEIESGASAAGKRNDPLEPGSDRLEPELVPASSEATGTLELVAARHPLLEENLRSTGGAVVPISFKLDDDNATMVISGANAGGKTVVLKTTGLLSLMALSGLPVPARQARVPFYQSILADIGDHQSLAANLSTFTSHVANIASMIASCETPALVLLDEVGTGTDPEEGSALGVAVVDHFKWRCAHVLATTHYSGLKMYAANEAGVLNASVEFDEKTLRPTYRLLVGFAGSSSRQAEFDTALTHSVSDFEKLSRELLSKIEDRAARLKVEREAERRTAELKREAQRVAQVARKSAQASLSQGQASRPRGQEGGLPPQLRDVRVVRDGKVISDGSVRRDTPSGADSTGDSRTVVIDDEDSGRGARAPSDLRAPGVGDRVRLRSLGSIGIVDQIKGTEVEVRVGSLHMREKLSNLELVDEASTRGGEADGRRDEVSTARVSGRVRRSLEDTRRRAQTTELHLHSQDETRKISSELNLIGKKTDEAIELADKFLDEAFLNGLSEVRIIHGHGTGALRRAIAEFLADHPHVAGFAVAPQEQGGAGATIVELRQ